MTDASSLNRQAVTSFLSDLARGHAAAEATLMPYVYEELRRIAAALVGRDRPREGLQPTELVHEAYLRLVDADGLELRDRSHFFSLAARAMRQLLVDDARTRKRLKRGGDRKAELLDEAVALAAGADVNLLDLDEALNDLARLSDRQGRVVEMRFFGGLEMDEIAQVLEVSKSTVERDWSVGRAWLGQRLGMGGR